MNAFYTLANGNYDINRIYCSDILMILHSVFSQGLSDKAVSAFWAMRDDGLKPSLLALNSLINAFGKDRRDVEAFVVLQYMKENVSC